MKRNKQIERNQKALIKEIKQQRKYTKKFNQETIKKKENNFITQQVPAESTLIDDPNLKLGTKQDDQFEYLDNQKKLTEDEKREISKSNSFNERIKKRFLQRINKQMSTIYQKNTMETDISKSSAVGPQTINQPKFVQEKVNILPFKEQEYQSYKKLVREENKNLGSNIKDFFQQSEFKTRLKLDETSLDKHQILRFKYIQQESEDDSQLSELFPKESFTVYNDQLLYLKGIQQTYRSQDEFQKLSSKREESNTSGVQLYVNEIEKQSFYEKYREYFSIDSLKGGRIRPRQQKDTPISVKDKVKETLLAHKMQLNPSLIEKQKLSEYYKQVQDFKNVVNGFTKEQNRKVESQNELKQRLKQTIDNITVEDKQIVKQKYIQLVKLKLIKRKKGFA